MGDKVCVSVTFSIDILDTTDREEAETMVKELFEEFGIELMPHQIQSIVRKEEIQ